jgi:hypothetical protein
LANRKTSKANPAKAASRFQPGNQAAIGNAGPTIKRHRRFMTVALRAKLDVVERGQQLTNLQRIVDALVRLAAAGDKFAIKLIYDRVEGLPVATVDMNVTASARELAEDMVARGASPAEMARMYQRSLNAPDDYDDDEGETIN